MTKRSWTSVYSLLLSIGFALLLSCSSSCQDRESTKRKNAERPPKSLEELFSRAIGKAVTEFWEKFFEKHGFEPFERALFKNLDEWTPSPGAKVRAVTISLFAKKKVPAEDIKLITVIDLSSEDKTFQLKYRAFSGKVTSPVAILNFISLDRDKIDVVDVPLYYDQSKKKWKIVKK